MRGLESSEFQAALGVVRMCPGRTFDQATKEWHFKPLRMTAERLLHMLTPQTTEALNVWLEQIRAADAEALSGTLPDDADLPNVSWAARLRPYQRAAVQYLTEHPHSILADDMGLGKTVESIATVVNSGGEGPILVVCPNSVRKKWAREIKQWTGEEAIIIDGANPAKRKAQLERAVKFSKWAVINWEKLRIMPELQKVKWRAVIADEAHRAKNRKAKQTKALWKITAPIQLALTGTPIQNSPDELWSLLKWLYPKTYTSYWRFFNDYVDYYEGHFGRIITGVRNPDLLRFELADKLVRRTKDEVLDLPEITWDYVPVQLTPEQRRLYSEAEREIWIKIEQDAAAGDTEAEKMLEDQLYFLQNGAARTTRLRQIASSPALLGGKDESGKLDAAVELIADAPPDKQFVVFTEFKPTVAALCERLEKRGVSVDAFTGETPQSKRDVIIDGFQNGESRVLCMTRDTGGEGIDLYAADTAIFIERHWNPSRNQQAESRLHRMGQENPVQIVVLIAEDTVDDGKVEPINRKKEAIVGTVFN